MSKNYPFDAAIFDLDGTLLDSMYVWKHIDDLFFKKRGMVVPADYGAALSGKSYRESAEYTIERFGFAESWQEIVQEWTDMAIDEYACRVQLKDGALEYLTALERDGVKLAVATALPEYLYRPCLTHLGVMDRFAALCSTDETGGRGKINGEVFLLAAERLGVAPERCAVFEDVYEGVCGAKKAGMRAYCVMDDAAAHSHEQLRCTADGMISSFWDVIPERRCAIFTARCDGNPTKAYHPRENDYILCADAGYEIARQLGVKPDVVIGDFDSMPAPKGENIIRHPVEKDEPDSMLCVNYGLQMGIKDFLIVGGIGGRLDHTLANLQTMIYIAEHGAKGELRDGNVRISAVKDGGIRVKRTSGKLGVFALGGKCEGVYIRGAKYNVENAVLTPDYPLGMGNDFVEDFAEIGAEKGTLLIVAEE